MKGKYLRRIGGLALSALMLFGVAFAASSDVQAQRRRRVVIVRPYPYRIYRPFGFGWNYPYGWGYDPWSPYGYRYSQYVFENSDDAAIRLQDGFKTGKDDGKKTRATIPALSLLPEAASKLR